MVYSTYINLTPVISYFFDIMCFDQLYSSQSLDCTHTESETWILKNVLYNGKYHPYNCTSGIP